MAYMINDWRLLVIYTFVIPTGVLSLATYLFIYESPLFIYKNDTVKALHILNKIAKVNKKQQLHTKLLQSFSKIEKIRIYSVIDLFRYKSLRLKTFSACMIFFSV